MREEAWPPLPHMLFPFRFIVINHQYGHVVSILFMQYTSTTHNNIATCWVFGHKSISRD